MRNGWTGGQYSLFRVVLGVYLLCVFLTAPTRPAGLVIGLVFVAGVLHRAAAVAALLLLAWIFRDAPLASPASPLVFMWVLVAHLFVPPAPYGSWVARGRPDPAGDWIMPPRIFLLAWIVLAAGYTWAGVAGVRDGTPWMAALLFAPLAFVARARPWLWLAGLVASVVALRSMGVVVAHLFTFDPGWIPAKRVRERDIMFFDGTCGLCHRSVRFALAEDPHPDTLVFAPLQGETFRATVSDNVNLPDSVVVLSNENTLVRSSAVLHVARRGGGFWRLLGALVALVPKSLRDALYDFVASIRHRLFRKPDDVCPVVAPQLRSRFLP
jgi:predicted DCC family thiol-disulfide oxidoreductase YuxK